MIETHLPKGVKKISLFEDYNEGYVTLVRRTTCLQPDLVRIAQPAVGAALAYRSLDGEELYVSFMVDAQHFFEARQPPWTWTSLQRSADIAAISSCNKSQENLRLITGRWGSCP